MSMWKRLVVTSVGSAVVVAGITIPVLPATAATTSFTSGAQVMAGVPAATQKAHLVRAIGQIRTPVKAGQTAYVYSSLRARNSVHRNLVDNEVRCSGAGRSDVVMGENVEPPATASPGRGDVTILNRFLVSATSTGTLACTLYARTTSLGTARSQVTVSGSMRFAGVGVGQDKNGTAMQTSLPNGNTVVNRTVRTPILDRRISAGHSLLVVGADVEYLACARKQDVKACQKTNSTSGTRFTLYANQMKGNRVCAAAKPAQVSVSVSWRTHHKAVPLYTKMALARGCDRVYAYVRAEHNSGPVGGIQGQAVNLTDRSGAAGPGVPDHDSTMTRLFAIPS